jgi:hypothetical protein
VRIFFPEWVRPVRAAFNDTLVILPGVVEAENFDKGGEGLSYHDSDDRNITGKYRPDEGVDIYDRLGTGFHIGNVMPGEWMEYSVNVTIEGWYTVTSHIAALIGGGKFQINADTVFTPEVTVPASNSALNTLPVSTSLYLHEGEQIIRFTILSLPSFNIDKISFELATGISAKADPANDISVHQDQQGNLIIVAQTDKNPKVLNLYTLNGQLIYSQNMPERETVIPAAVFHPGIYLIQGFTKTGKFSKKIVIRKD